MQNNNNISNTVTSLSYNAKQAADALRNLTQQLQCPHPDMIECACSRLMLECSLAEAKRCWLRQRLLSYRDRRIYLQSRIHPSLLEFADQYEQNRCDIQVKTAGYKQNITALTAKQQDYRTRLESLETAANGRRNGTEIATELLSAKQRMEDSHASLEQAVLRKQAFASLPPDPQLALLELEQLRKENAELETERQQLLTQFIL